MTEQGAAPAGKARNFAPGTLWVTDRPHYDGPPSMAGRDRASGKKRPR